MRRALSILPLLAITFPLVQAETTEPPAPGTETPPAATDSAAGNSTTATPAEERTETQAAPDTPAETSQGAKAMDASRRLRDKLALVDTELASISKPTRSLTNLCKSRKDTINSSLERLDKIAMEVAMLQERFNAATSKAFEFTIVQGDDRDKYVRDGKAAHKAMLIDMKEKKSTRKIRGLDKFEIMRDRYQGMPEFKEANEWYNRTIDDLEKKWTKMQTAEKARRDRLSADKKQRMSSDDDLDFSRLEQQLKAAGEDIAKIWYTPSQRNLRMLSNCLNKVRDVQRRRGSMDVKGDNIGCVPSLLSQFWEMMDNAKSLMLNGDLRGAQDLIDNDPSFNRIVRLNRNVMPDEYKTPLKDQRQALINEIRQRTTENTRTQRNLESKIAELERNGSAIEGRIDALLEAIDRERGVDAGENKATTDDAELEDNKPEKTPENNKKEEAAK